MAVLKVKMAYVWAQKKSLLSAVIAYLGVVFFQDIFGTMAGNTFYHSLFQLLIFLFWFCLLKYFPVVKDIYTYVLGMIYAFCMSAGRSIWDLGIAPVNRWDFWCGIFVYAFLFAQIVGGGIKYGGSLMPAIIKYKSHKKL